MNRLLQYPVVVAFACLPLTCSAIAGAQQPAGATLPGVEGDYRIVKPVQPEPEEADTGTAGSFKIGDIDVHVGGRVTVDITTGPLSTKRR